MSKLNEYFNSNDLEKSIEKASEILIKEIQDQLDFLLPKDYVDVMKDFNGGEGGIGENSWLYLFPLEELLEQNHSYKLLMKEIPDYFLFGKDAADTGYAFHKQFHTIHSFGLM